MWLHKSLPFAIVVMVVMIVLVKVTRGSTDFRPRFRRFHAYGCWTNVTTYSKLNMTNLRTRPAFLIGLSGTNQLMLTSSSASCKLRPNILFCVVPSTKDNKFALTFHESPAVFQEDKPDQDLGRACVSQASVGDHDKEEGNKQSGRMMKNKQKDTICNFEVDDQLSLQAGYGFISCQTGNTNASVEQWREWVRVVTAYEEEIGRGKNKILTAVICGTGAFLLLVMVCVVCRLRCARSTPYHSQRRPSNISGQRTSSTHDHPSRT